MTRLLEAYAAGVNDGLASLSSRPFEYLLLRTEPAEWTAEDSLLVVYSMYLQLQDENAWRDRSRRSDHACGRVWRLRLRAH